jgi:hypothetical protein
MFLASTSFLGLVDGQWTIIGALTAVIVAVAGLIWLIIRAVFAAGTFMERFNNVETSLAGIKRELHKLGADLSARIDNLANISIQESLSEAHSPRQLNGNGKKVLKNSGINTVVDDRFDQIVSEVQDKKPVNAYQAEQAVLEVVESLMDDAVVKDAVENGAFQSGHSIAAVLFVGGLYIRDKVLAKLGFVAKDIDRHMPKDAVHGDSSIDEVSKEK